MPLPKHQPYRPLDVRDLERRVDRELRSTFAHGGPDGAIGVLLGAISDLQNDLAKAYERIEYLEDEGIQEVIADVGRGAGL